MSTANLNSELTNFHLAFRRKLYSFLLLAISGYTLLWVAIFNGYPVFFPDSSQYLWVSFDLKQPIYRTISYSVFIRLVTFGISPWLVVIAQSVIAIFILHSLFMFIVRQSEPVAHRSLIFLGLAVFLAFGTTLPWYVGQIMPDVFTGLAFLSLFLLLYDSNLSPERTILISVVLCISVAAHITHLLAATVLLVVVFVLRFFGAFREFWPARSTKGIVAFVLIPILAAAGLVGFSNWRLGYGFSLSPGKSVFMFGRLIESGLVADYLQQRCGTEEFTACKYLHNLPRGSQDLIWSPHPLLHEMGGWSGARAEAGKIVSGTIRRYPLRFAAECLKMMFRQLVTFTAGAGNYSIRTGPEYEGFRLLYPGDVPKYDLSRQSVGKLFIDAYQLTPLYAAVFWGSLGVSLIALLTKRLRTRTANQLFVLTLVFLFANAFATGAFSGANDRYQARAVWVMGLCCSAYIIPYVLHWRRAHSVISDDC